MQGNACMHTVPMSETVERLVRMLRSFVVPARGVGYSIQMWPGPLTLLVVVLSLHVLGCSSSPVRIPETLQSQIDQNLTFSEVLTSPESYRGRLILLGGQILKGKRMKEGTRVELLQLPLNKDEVPTSDLTRSQGRVLVLHQDAPDPATLTPGMLVTFVGEVNGGIIEKIDEADYRYPTLIVKHWYVWPPAAYDGRGRGPYYGVYGGINMSGGLRRGGGFGLGF